MRPQQQSKQGQDSWLLLAAGPVDPIRIRLRAVVRIRIYARSPGRAYRNVYGRLRLGWRSRLPAGLGSVLGGRRGLHSPHPPVAARGGAAAGSLSAGESLLCLEFPTASAAIDHQIMRKTYKQLPFENKKQPRGNLLCADADLRIEPPRSGAMSLAQLREAHRT